MAWATEVRDFCTEHQLAVPSGVDGVEGALVGSPGEPLLYRNLGTGAPPDVGWALRELRQAAAPEVLLPFLPACDASFACVVCGSGEGLPEIGFVVRFHLDDVASDRRITTLDVNATSYAESLAAELTSREPGRRRVQEEIGPAYREKFLAQLEPAEHPDDSEGPKQPPEPIRVKRPRPYELRPVRLACQNVVVALAAYAYDSTFDGLRVEAWQTCEVPHLATHEAARALAAITLCEAYGHGGTMEIRFDKHPEEAIPSSLRRLARVRGVEIGSADPLAIVPREARDLYLQVTPMPDGLRKRAAEAAEARITTPERLCFTLLAGVWTPLEVDFMLAVSPRAQALLGGGSSPADRASRQAETEVARAASLAGLLYRRLRAIDPAGDAGEVRVLEDQRAPVTWTVIEELAAVRFAGIAAGPVPWTGATIEEGQGLVVLPRTVAQPEDYALAAALGQSGERVAILIPGDMADARVDAAIAVLEAPSRLDEIDAGIDRRLLKSRIARA